MICLAHKISDRSSVDNLEKARTYVYAELERPTHPQR